MKAKVIELVKSFSPLWFMVGAACATLLIGYFVVLV